MSNLNLAYVSGKALIRTSEEFFEFYTNKIDYDLHSLLWDLTKAPEELEIWPQFSLDKISLLPGESLKDLLLANSQVLARKAIEIYGLSSSVTDLSLKIYIALAKKKVSLASPFFNNLRKKDAGNLASCFIMEVDDSLESIMKSATYAAEISKAGGGIGCYLGLLRGKGATVGRNTNAAQSVTAWIKIFDSVCAAVNQQGRRPGAMTVALPIWHADIEDFLELQTEVGDLRGKAYNVQTQVVLCDEFMQAVVDNQSWPLYCPKSLRDAGLNPRDLHADWSRQAKALELSSGSVSARDLWAKIQKLQVTIGRPYLFFQDAVNEGSPFIENFGPIQSANLCVAPETLVLTKQGYKSIASLAGTSVEVWNGKEWSLSPVFKTSGSAQLKTVRFSDGSEVDTTDQHNWWVKSKANERGKNVKVTTADLKPGMVIPKIQYPVIEGAETFQNAYTQGLFAADGNYALRGKPGRLEPNIYGTKVARQRVRLSLDLLAKDFVPNASYTLENRLDWLAGYLDGDACIAKQANGVKSLQVTTTDLSLAIKIRLMLQEMGVKAACSEVTTNRYSHKLPGEKPDMIRKPAVRLCIASAELLKLQNLGLKTKRLNLSFETTPTQSKTQYVKVESIVDYGRVSDTYCLTEPKLNTVVFNGVVSSQCVESYSFFKSDEYIHTCNLISVNVGVHTSLEEIEESASLAALLCDLSHELSSIDITEVKNHVQDFRTIGVGLMGLADWLAYNETSYGDTALIEATAKAVALGTYKQSLICASLAGHCQEGDPIVGLLEPSALMLSLEQEHPELADKRKHYGIRNALMLCTAPNTSTSIVMGACPSFLPPYDLNGWVEGNNDISSQVVLRYHPNDYVMDIKSISPDFILDAALAIQKWTDAGVSAEFLLVKGKPSSENKAFSDLKLKAWNNNLKAVYYIRTSEVSNKPSGPICESCQN
jgi:ribonucleoside-diphosphate reductase alpha chain